MRSLRVAPLVALVVYGCAEGGGSGEDTSGRGAGGATGAVGGMGGTSSSESTSQGTGGAGASGGMGVGGAAGMGGSGPMEQACPAGQFAIGVDGSGTLMCAGIDPMAQLAVNTGCWIYMGWRDACDGCALAPTKWGRVGATTCTNGAGTNNTCTTTTLGNNAIELFGLNLDGDTDDNDKLYTSLHCGPGSNQSAAGPCAGDELVTDVAGGSVTCTSVSGAVLEYVRNNCSIYLGWRDACDGCTTAPAKWGRVHDGTCSNGVGVNNTCTTQTLGTEMVRLFGLNTDGNVDENDKFYVGLRCITPASLGGPTPGPCPAGQFVTGTHTDGSLECASPAALAATYFRNKCTLYFGWRDACNGCGSPPAKWGSVRDGFCQNGIGANNTCTLPSLGSEAVNLFGLNVDGDVDDNDTLYVGFRCL